MSDFDPVGRPAPAFAFGRPRAIAFDFDGTLTDHDRPAAETLDALGRLRERGISIILVTGRILSELEGVFAEVGEHFDALVVENGAVIVVDDHSSSLALPIDQTLVGALGVGGIDARQGEVIVATSAAEEHGVLDAVTDLGLECQLVRNRTELMILPSGVNKGNGLTAALGALGLSPHDCLAVGDAENDHSLLAAAEFGVAVANAVGSLKAEADLVLSAPDGAGVIELIDDVIGPNHFWPARSRPGIAVGRDADRRPVLIPARPTNMIVVGGSGDGKSYLAGLLAEQLMAREYSVLVVDPEGDHRGLGALGPSVVVGADQPPPPVGMVMSLLQRSDACVVIDLSGLDEPDRQQYLAEIPVEVEARRRASGRPHWVFFDEAHQSVGQHEAALGTFEPAAHGYCLITWRPDDLPASIVASIEIVLALTSPAPDDAVVDLVAAIADQPKEVVAVLLARSTGHVVVARRQSTEPPEVARLGVRLTAHTRHEHKYDAHGVSLERSFWFRDHDARTTGAVARSLHELEHELTQCQRSVVRHHAKRRDFSRWIGEVFQDRLLEEAVRLIECRVESTSPGAVVDAARLDLVSVLGSRHEA